MGAGGDVRSDDGAGAQEEKREREREKGLVDDNVLYHSPRVEKTFGSSETLAR